MLLMKKQDLLGAIEAYEHDGIVDLMDVVGAETEYQEDVSEHPTERWTRGAEHLALILYGRRLAGAYGEEIHDVMQELIEDYHVPEDNAFAVAKHIVKLREEF